MSRLTFNPCDECVYSYSKNNQEMTTCKCCEFRTYLDLEEQGRLVEVIRCKDCIRYGDEYVVGAGWCDEHEHLTNDDDYCSYAVAKLAEVEDVE